MTWGRSLLFYLWSALLLTGCVRRTEVKSVATTDTKVEATSRTEESADNTVRERDTLRQGPTTLEIVVTTEKFTPDGGLALRRTRRSREVVGPLEETKDTSADEQRQLTANSELEEVKHAIAKRDSIETVKPASCLGLRLGVTLGVMAAVAAYLLWRRVKWRPW